jgi:hypothetical protein
MTWPTPTRASASRRNRFLSSEAMCQPSFAAIAMARGFAPADVSDQLREHGDGAEVADDFDLQPAVADRSIERGPLLWDRDLLAYVLRHHELVVRDLGQQAKPRHVHQVDEHVGIRDDDAEERCAHGVGSLSAAMPESSRS